MTELVLTRGLPASGKTTFARAWVAEAVEPERRVRVNRDDLRQNLFGVYWGLTFEQEQAVTLAQHGAIKALLRKGVSVVVDDTNLRLKNARALADVGAQHGADLRVIDFTHVPVETCVARDRDRRERGERAVGEEPIRKMHARYLAAGPLDPVTPSERPQEPASRYVPDPALPGAWLVDVDGTLARMISRGPFEWGRVGEDEPVAAVVELVWALTREFEVVLLSGRDAVCRPETERWLAAHNVPYHELLMRPEGDNRPDATIKEEIFWRDVAPRWNVVGVLDDRDRVVAMWRRLGLVCAQVAPGDF